MVATAVQGRSAISAPPGSAGDVTLACMLAAKDPRALDEIYRRHAAAVMGAARRITRDAALAEDITQDVFVRLWRAPAKYDPNRGSLRAFLVTVARGRSIDLIRSETARRSREERDGAPLVSEAAPADEEAFAVRRVDDVRRALATLPDRERRAIEMAYFGGHSYRQVAGMLGEPEGTVKTRIRAGIARLGGALRSSGWDG